MVCASLVYSFWLGSWNLLSYFDFFFISLELLFWWNGEISRNNKNWKTFISCQWRFLKLYFPKWKHMSDLWSECVLLFCHFSSSSVVVITVFTVFRLLTDFVFLYTYAFWLSFLDCSEFGNFVITLNYNLLLLTRPIFFM